MQKAATDRVHIRVARLSEPSPFGRWFPLGNFLLQFWALCHRKIWQNMGRVSFWATFRGHRAIFFKKKTHLVTLIHIHRINTKTINAVPLGSRWNRFLINGEWMFEASSSSTSNCVVSIRPENLIMQSWKQNRCSLPFLFVYSVYKCEDKINKIPSNKIVRCRKRSQIQVCLYLARKNYDYIQKKCR
jgi:hypothetical protein